jgi:hypothetical protein
VTAEQVDDYGAFNISLINDLPLFIDPFLLFNSGKPEYQQLHDDILRYMIFLRDKIASGDTNPDLIKAWFMFPEVKQNWMGFSLHGNGGSGLGKDFAEALRANLQKLFADFGKETITSSSHIEKVCLVRSGVGRDMISDFTTNLLKDYICWYTEKFAVDHIDPSLRRRLPINKALFNYDTENWERRTYDLPYANGDFVLLTPKDMLTRDETLVSLALAITIAPAEAIDLSCKGVMHTYEMEQKQGTVGPGAAVVDLERKRIATPVGNFRITTISDESIAFDDPTSKELVVFGTLDRISGAMNVFWRHPGGDNSHAAMYADLKCFAAKRLF